MTIRATCAALLLAVATALAPGVAHAQQSRTIDVPPGKKWQHAGTGLILPQTLAGLGRTGITDSTADELDVFVQYGDPGTTSLTIYVFRPPLAVVPVWFDRIETQILNRDVYGNATPAGAAIAFALPQTPFAGGLRRIYTPGKPPYTATGAAMLPLGTWMIAARLSSTTLDAKALDAKLIEALGGLGWPAPATGAAAPPPATPIAACADTLTFSKNAKVKKADMTVALLGALIANVRPEDLKAETKGPTGFCREGKPETTLATYRSLGGGTGYVIALGDAGRSVSVTPELALGEAEPGYSITLHDLARSFVFPSFDKLPAPERVMEMVKKTRPISSASRGGKEISIGVK